MLGANDGLCSNLSLVMGVAGTTASNRFVLLAGLAGLVAGACSMAMGEWLSVTSSREFATRQIEAEAEALDADPDAEKEALAQIYRTRGLTETTARSLVSKLFVSRSAALDTLTREELGIDPEERGGSPTVAAASSFCLFAIGAICPVAPFLFAQGAPAVAASLALSGFALAAIGAATTLFTGRNLAWSALRTLTIGYAAAGLTFLAGRGLDGSIS